MRFDAETQNRELSNFVVRRPERGYLETDYDDKPEELPKSLRGQIEQNYDVKKVRNTFALKAALCFFRFDLVFIGLIIFVSIRPTKP